MLYTQAARQERLPSPHVEVREWLFEARAEAGGGYEGRSGR